MAALIIFIQIVSLVVYFQFLNQGEDYDYVDRENEKFTVEGCLWYFLAGLNFLFILRSFYVIIMYSYSWYDYILEFISFGISLFITIPTSIYLLIKRYRKKKRSKNNK